MWTGLSIVTAERNPNPKRLKSSFLNLELENEAKLNSGSGGVKENRIFPYKGEHRFYI
jgi:hypothetical protein